MGELFALGYTIIFLIFFYNGVKYILSGFYYLATTTAEDWEEAVQLQLSVAKFRSEVVPSIKKIKKHV
jgi:hypothetical protein